MKTIKYLIILTLTFFTATACMNEHDEPDFNASPFGNNSIGEATTTIADLKSKYKSIIEAKGVQEITEDIIIEGIVVSNDISGNVYKQFVIEDETEGIIIGVNDVGLYAMLPIGQQVRINCKGLHIGGYGKLAQLGGLYNGSIGRMNKYIFPNHVRLIGTPDASKITPQVIDESFFTETNRAKLPKLVRIDNVKFQEADGNAKYAPEELKNSSNVVERSIKVGGKKVIFRISTYADFANDILPTGNFDVTGVLTRYNDYWQFMLTSTEDIIPVSE